MLLPILPLDYELASPGDVEVGPDYRAARVFVRWHGVPIAVIQVPVVSGKVRSRDVGLRIMARQQARLGREMARRALINNGILEPLDVRKHGPDPEAPNSASTISVAVCTRDRPEDMKKCLASLAALRVKPLEVIIVDNAPATEATKELVQNHFPQFRYVREETPGLDHARNRAIVEAKGAIIAYTDDDVMVDPDWIGALGRVFAEDPSIGLVTGLIEPAELETEAQALFERYGGFGRGCARTYLQSAAPGAPMPWNLVGAGQLGAGANMAIRRELFDRIGHFDPALDVGTPTLGGGDHEIFFRCIRSGMICLYEPTAIVRHRHRRTIAELSKLLYSYGHATRCFFDREADEFPEDRAGVKKLASWWWRHWAWERFKRSWWSPTWFPLELVNREIKGYWDARKGGYTKARRKIVADEAKRPDTFRIAPVVHGPPKTGLAVVDVSKPLPTLNQDSSKDTLEVLVQWRDKPLGRMHLNCKRTPIVPSRLADEISRIFWWQIVTLGDESPDIIWARHMTHLQDLVQPEQGPDHPLSDEIGVSLVICTCDRPDDLRRCLTSLKTLETKRRVQVIVVDNRPGRPGTREVLRDFPDVELVEESRPGSSYARNAGLAAAREEIVAMTDDDMVVSPHWLERLVEPFSRADVAAVTGNTLPASLETEAELLFEAYGGFCRGYHGREYDEYWFHYWKRRATPTWQLGGTGNMALRRSLFDDPQIGPFEEALGAGVPAGVGEDTMWFYQALRAGHVILYEAAAVAWHHHRITHKALHQQLFAYSKGHVAYHLLTFMKYRDKRALVRVAYELPQSMMSRYWNRLRGRYDYPWKLLAIETAGMLLGPWSLWKSLRHVKKHGPGARPVEEVPVTMPPVPAADLA
ncbi:glycosyltransferase [Luteolibacter soli]|uniref:Glycosyltransferase n=1 Tax=Luteolibacter soli TaxID=3135280 RepID=A0ABU9AQW9_9BACT